MKEFVLLLILLNCSSLFAFNDKLDKQLGAVVKISLKDESAYKKTFCSHASNSLERTYNQSIIDIFNCEQSKLELRIKDKSYVVLAYVKSFSSHRDMTVYSQLKFEKNMTSYGPTQIWSLNNK